MRKCNNRFITYKAFSSCCENSVTGIKQNFNFHNESQVIFEELKFNLLLKQDILLACHFTFLKRKLLFYFLYSLR